MSTRRYLRACAEPGCPNLTMTPRCPEHTPRNPWTRPRPLPPGWRRLRASILKRDGYRCVECGAPATEVHHIVDRALGGTDHPSNLESLCAPHHQARTVAAAARARKARRRS